MRDQVTPALLSAAPAGRKPTREKNPIAGNLRSAGKTGSSSAKVSLDHKIRENGARRDLKSSS